MKILATTFALVLSLAAMPLHAAGSIGVVLMHGKSGTSKPASPVGVLAEFLSGKGILVATPDMPWSRSRMLEKSYEDSMAEIDSAVAELKAQGATTIVVGGHSMGANAALGYGASRDGIAGIMAIAPGHIPEDDNYQSGLGHDWKRAKKMVDAGKGSETAQFNDRNQGQDSTINATADIYLSWFSPNGDAVMPKNASRLKPQTALLWIIGEQDSMMDRGRGYAFSKAPSHPKNAYVVVGGGHGATPKKGKKEILDWLKSL